MEEKYATLTLFAPDLYLSKINLNLFQRNLFLHRQCHLSHVAVITLQQRKLNNDNNLKW